jgi:hypothetical protein
MPHSVAQKVPRGGNRREPTPTTKARMLLSLSLPIALIVPAAVLSGAARALGRLLAGQADGRAPRQAPGEAPPPPARLWVLSAAHDEEQRLPAWLAALQAQRGCPVPLRPVLADDGSADGGPDWARRQHGDLVFLPGGRRGKLATLQRAIDYALAHGEDGDGVLFTDADCRPEPGWAAAHLAALEAGFGLVVGHMEVDVPGGGPAQRRLRRLESAVSSLQSALGAVRGRPAFARGGNWSTTLGRLRAVGGLAGLEGCGSGDDILLPRRLLDAGAASAALIAPQSWILTDEAGDGAAAAQGRRRRYAKAAVLDPRERRHQLGLIFSLGWLMAFPLAALEHPALLLAWAGAGGLLAAAAWTLLRMGLALYGLKPGSGDALGLLRLPLWTLAGRLRRRGRFDWKGRTLRGPAA